MKCPYCEYKTGGYWNDDDVYVSSEEEHGDFYTLTNGIMLDRSTVYYEKDTKDLNACPKCGKTFIEV